MDMTQLKSDKFRLVTLAGSAIALLLATVSICGWALSPESMTDLRSAHLMMTPATALIFIMIGGAMFIRSVYPDFRPARSVAALLVILANILCAVILLGYLPAIGHHFEEKFISGLFLDTGLPAGRMSPDTAVTLIVAGLSFLTILFAGKKKAGRMAGAVLAAIVGINGLVLMTGYMYGAPFLHNRSIVPMSALSALSFIIVGGALVFMAGPESWPLASLTGPGTRARLLRAFLPFTVVILMSLGLFDVTLSRFTSVNPALIEFVLIIPFLLAVIFIVARLSRNIGASIDSAHEEKLRAERALREAEKRYRHLFENLGDAAVIADAGTGMILEVNREAEALFGWPREELVGQHQTRLHPPEQEEYWRARFQGRVHGGGSGSFHDAEVINREGLIIPASINASKLDINGQKVVLGIFRDITSLVQAYDNLRRERDLVERIMETSPAGVLMLDAAGHVTFANAAAETVLGTSKENIISRRFDDDQVTVTDFAGNPVPDGERVFQQAINRAVPIYGINHAITFSTGKRILLNMNAAPVFEDAGVVDGVVVTIEDVTEKINLERRLLEAQKMEAVGILAGGVAHDFNNLLMVIQGNAELELMGLKADAPIRETLTTISEASRKASSLVQQLLAFSRRQILNPDLLDVTEMVTGFKQMLSWVINEEIKMLIEVAPGAGNIFVDRTTLEQVVMNLTVNARDAMPDGGELRIEAARAIVDQEFTEANPDAKPGNYVRISVSDTGNGIDEQTMSHIFEPFFSNKEEGTGLGLSIVYGIVKQQGGFINVTSKIGEGTRFDVYFPEARPGAGVPAVDSERKQQTAPGGSETILLAEDEGKVRELLTTFLESYGYKVLAASDGQEALRMFTEQQDDIDIVVLDAVMPHLSGPRAYEKIREIRPGVLCLFLTGYSDEITEKFLASQSGLVVLKKPINSTELAMAVRRMLDSGR